MFCRINFNLQNYTYFRKKTNQLTTIVINNVGFFPKTGIFLAQIRYYSYPKLEIPLHSIDAEMPQFEIFLLHLHPEKP